jgi:hypothetical protein
VIAGLTQNNKYEKYTCYICSVLCFCTDAILTEIRRREFKVLIDIKNLSEESLKKLQEI